LETFKAQLKLADEGNWNCNACAGHHVAAVRGAGAGEDSILTKTGVGTSPIRGADAARRWLTRSGTTRHA